MRIGPELPALLFRSVAEVTACPIIPTGAINRLPQVIGAVRGSLLIGLLRLVARPGKIAVSKPRNQLIGLDHDDRGGADEHLPAIVVGKIDHGIRNDFGFIDRRHRLWLVGQAALHSAKLRCVDRRQLHQRDFHVAVLVEQFGTHRLGEALDGML